MLPITIIYAVASNHVIGNNNDLPWKGYMSSDLRRFSRKTKPKRFGANTIIVMGRDTFRSINRKLDGRINVVLSKSYFADKPESLCVDKLHNDFYYAKNEESLHDLLCSMYYSSSMNIENIFFIGGVSVFNLGLKWGAQKIMITKIHNAYPGDVIFDIEKNDLFRNYEMIKASSTDASGGVTFHYESWKRTSLHPEYEYLNLLEKVLYTGEQRHTRNAYTISRFGESIEFDLSMGFPLLTTKKMFFKGIVEELLWFIRGDTNAKHLNDKGVRIWNGNSSREYLDRIGHSDYPEFCCGPIYGFQWRHFNAPYSGCDSDYSGSGVDQFAECIRQIREEPTSRRILFTGWNPCQLNEMVLPPCHVMYQFYVHNDNRLDCHMYQRSGDIFLGVPFNIASTALLTHIVAAYTGKIPGKIRISFGDLHIYDVHTNAVRQQLHRMPFKFCDLSIVNIPQRIEDMTMENVVVSNYVSNDAISAPMIP